MKNKLLISLLATYCFLVSPELFAADPLLKGLGLDSAAAQKEEDFTCAPLPPATPPAQHSAAEGLPPLPLPVVPLRRTEKKNPPRPPVLIAKIATKKQSDWATNPGDTKNLLKWMAKNFNVHFSEINLPENQLPADAANVPVLYRTGHDAFEFSHETRSRLRSYLLSGGTLILDACCGRTAFVESAIRELRLLIPERPPYFLENDHPLFSSFFEIKNIRYRPYALQAGAVNDDPAIIGIDIGCRTAVFFFRWDVSCGWDDQPDTDRHRCLGYEIDTAKQLGANLLAYITAERSAAMPLSKALNFVDAEKGKSGKFLIAEVKYSGQWKCREAGLSMLLNSYHEQTKTPVRFEREEISLNSNRLFDMPFIYMTGHQSFTLSEQEKNNLRQYLQRGGILFAESCCGREGFAKSFKREISTVLPGLTMERIDNNHQIFNFPNMLQNVMPRSALAEKLQVNKEIAAELYGINYRGQSVVIFSPFGLACGWELAECPYCKGIQAKDAIALGVNILSYIMLQ